MNNKFVIFGASIGGVKVYDMLASIGMECEYFVDNAASKWGTLLKNKEIKSPDDLLNNDLNIIIASVYQEEIEIQLEKNGILKERIVPREKYVRDFIESNADKYEALLAGRSIVEKPRELILDLDHGLEIGGIESWSFSVAKAALLNNMNVTIYTTNTSETIPFGLTKIVKYMDLSKIDFEKEILNIAVDILKKLPCIFIGNWMEHSFWAAYILKKLYPNDIFIVGMVHHDMLCYYRRNQYLQEIVDKFLCVSIDTQKRMIDEFKVDSEKVLYKEVPIAIEENFTKEIRDKQKVCIGMGSRLDVAKKRVDLIIPLIEILCSKKIEFVFKIAGNGGYYNKLNSYILEHNLEEQVILLGEISPEKMDEFWKSCDIVISTSDSEGMGLSVLEAMAYGAVPVVTDTAGMKYFIENDINGYRVEINDIHAMADRIESLINNRNRLCEMGKKARDIIVNKCSPLEYVEFIADITRQFHIK